MIMLRFALVIIAVCAAGRSHADAYPREVEAAIAEERASCGAKVEFEEGFVARRDVNGDGIDDYLLDFGKFSCDGNGLLYCGSAGCLTQLFASRPDGSFFDAFSSNVHDIEFKTVGGKPAMLLSLHGSACGKIGAAPCRKTLIWNGKAFKPKR